MTDLDILRAKIISPETSNYFHTQVLLLMNQMCDIIFPADPVEREHAILAYTELAAKKRTYETIIAESEEAVNELKLLQSN